MCGAAPPCYLYAFISLILDTGIFLLFILMAFQNIIGRWKNSAELIHTNMAQWHISWWVGLGDVTCFFVLSVRRVKLISRWRILKTRGNVVMIEPTMHVTKEGAENTWRNCMPEFKATKQFVRFVLWSQLPIVLGLKWLWCKKHKNKRKERMLLEEWKWFHCQMEIIVICNNCRVNQNKNVVVYGIRVPMLWLL